MQATQLLIKLKSLNKQDLLDVKGIGEVLADNFLDFLQSPRYDKLLQDFGNLEEKNQGIHLDFSTFTEKINSQVSNKKFVITGSFNKSRGEIKKELEKLGAKQVSSVSAKTDFLLAGEKPGSKLEKAKELNIPVFYTSQEFNQEFNLNLDF